MNWVQLGFIVVGLYAFFTAIFKLFDWVMSYHGSETELEQATFFKENWGVTPPPDIDSAIKRRRRKLRDDEK